MARPAPLLLTAAALSWVVVLLAAPLALAHGFALAPAIVYEAAGLICHQRPERSFHLAGIQLPVCARCFGLYASGALGAAAACLVGVFATVPAQRRSVTALAVAALPTAATLAVEWSGLSHPGSLVRALAALPLGALAGWLFVRGLAASRPTVGGLRQVRYHS